MPQNTFSLKINSLNTFSLKINAIKHISVEDKCHKTRFADLVENKYHKTQGLIM
jgi:hypothetical protein